MDRLVCLRHHCKNPHNVSSSCEERTRAFCWQATGHHGHHFTGQTAVAASGANGDAGTAAPGATAGHDMPPALTRKESLKDKVRCSCVARLAYLRRQKCPSFWWRKCLLMLVTGVAMCTCIRYVHACAEVRTEEPAVQSAQIKIGST